MNTNKIAAITFAALSLFATLCWFFSNQNAQSKPIHGLVTILFIAISIIFINMAHNATNDK